MDFRRVLYRPGLLLLDEDMPGLPGIDLLRELRGNRNSAMLPVIITTTSTEPAIAAAAFNAGADDHVVMPCDFRMLSARIERQLNRAREMRSEEHTSELQSLMRLSYAVFCLKNQNTIQ